MPAEASAERWPHRIPHAIRGGKCVLYSESTLDEDRLDDSEGVSGGSGYLKFWERCWSDVLAYRGELHGEFKDLDRGEVIKSF